MDEVTVMAPVVALGSQGINPDAFDAALGYDPDVIAMDGGSIDYGPYYLGTGTPYAGRNQVKGDLDLVLPAAKERDIPAVLGTAGGAGARPHVDWTLDIIGEIAAERDLELDVAVVETDIDPERLKEWIDTRQITPVGHEDPLTVGRVDESDHIVCQVGVESIVEGFEADPDIVLVGRSCDNAVIASYPVYQGLPKGLALHMGDILECADFAAKPKPEFESAIGDEGNSTGPMIGTITEDAFEITPADDRMVCTDLSIAAHSLYESRNPYRSAQPGGTLEMSDCVYEEVDERTTRVSGTEFVPAETYTIKLEGAGRIGYRAICIMGIRDPLMVENIEEITDRISRVMTEKYRERDGVECEIATRIYGKNAVMGDLEPEEGTGHELGLLVEVISDTEENAKEICGSWKSRILHSGEGKIPTSGSVAFPFSPPSMGVGEAVDLTVYHALSLEDPTELTTVEEIALSADEEPTLPADGGWS